MLAVLRRRNFALLWLGQLISQISDMVLLIAILIQRILRLQPEMS